jgi:hypothetical protein
MIAMRRNVRLGLAVVAAGALLVASGLFTSGGGAAPTPDRPTKQELAQRLLQPSRARFLTPAARAYLTMVANGNRSLSQDAQGSGAKPAPPQAEARAAGSLPPAAGFPNVRVNDPGADRRFLDQTTQSETTIAAHGRNVAVGYNDSQHTLLFLTAASSIVGFSYSTDGGRSFHDGGALPNAPGQVNLSDPWMASDRAGRFYYATLAFDQYINLGVSVARSDNGGRSWRTPVELIQSANYGFYQGDKDAMTAGRDPAVASRDNLYVAWDDFFCDPTFTDCFTGLPVARSTDHGATWQLAYADKGPLFGEGCSFQQYIGAQPFVDSRNGILYVAAERIAVDDPDCVGAPVVRSEVMFKSTNGGKSFGPRVTIATATPAAPGADGISDVLFLDPGRAIRTIEFPVVARVGNSLYVAWNDGAQGPSHIRLARSSDGGATWSLSWATGGAANHLQPALSGDAAGLHLLYYRVDGNHRIDVLLQDRRGGATRTRRVTTRSFPGVFNAPQFDPIVAFFYMGDYIANVSSGGHRLFAWGDNRDIVRNQLWPQGRHDPDVFFARD